MTYIYQFDNKSGARRLLGWLSIAVALSSAGCIAEMDMEVERIEADSTGQALSLASAPAATFTTIRPLDDDAIVYEPLAPRTALAARDAQLTIDVVLRNDQASTINVDRVQLSYGGAVVLPSVTLETSLQKKCDGEDIVDLVDDRAIAPNESCRVMLTPDQKLPIPAPSQITIAVYFVGYTNPVSVTKTLKAHRNAPSEGSYRFPAKAEDLPAGQYWSAQSSGAGSHHRGAPSQFYAYDAGLVRWDAASSTWSNKHPGASGAANADYLVWGQPIYAMADGVVLAYENNQDDNIPGQEVSSANFFRIQHGDEIGEYYHLKKGSLNPALLSVGATVTEGQYLGQVGNSGSSNFPHLHVQVTKGGVGMPLLFHEVFLIDRSVLGAPPDFNAPFTAVEDQGLPWEKNIIWPSPFRRIDQDADSAISDVAIARSSGSSAVTAARSAAGNLELVTWDINSDGFIVSRQKEIAGPASEIAIAQPGLSSEVVTAFRNSGGNLEVISWDIVAGTGGIAKLGEASAGPVSKVAMTRAPIGLGVVTAFRNGSGNLGLIAWETSSLGAFTRQGDATAYAITDVAITSMFDPFDGVVTAARDSAGNLVLTTWEFTAAKQLIRRDDVVAGPVSELALATVRVAYNKELIITGVRTGGGNFELIAWEVTATGDIVRRGEAGSGAISEIAIAADGTSQLVSAIRDSGGELKLIAWEVTLDGQFVREGESTAGSVSNVALTNSFTNSGRKFAVPAMRDSAGDLRLISWQTNLTP